MPHTDFPITFKELQALMNSIGVFLVQKDLDKIKPRLHWERDRNVPVPPGFQNTPDKVTTLLPDFEFEDHQVPVYDRAYVEDLLTVIMGARVVDAKHRIQAILSWMKKTG